MWDRRAVHGAPLLLLLLLLTTVLTRSDIVSRESALAWTWFPHLVSKDTDMDPAKAEIFEGDIIIDRSSHRNFSSAHGLRRNSISRRRRKGSRKRHSRRRTGRAATARTDRLWPHAIIPYEIEANFSGEHRALFKQAMRYWENETCVQFVERSPAQHPDYIVFTERACGCCSFVGRRGNGAQAISIGKNCDKFGIVVHELGHVVGFWHEHTRPDRDKHVQIITRNIVAGQEYNFNKLTEEEVNSLGLNYDYESIMHYARNTFSRSTALDTILPIRGKVVEIGQRVRLSPGDIAQTNMLYKCPACGRTYQEPSSFFQSPGYESNRISTSHQRCEWRISATQGERISFEITGLDIDPNCDSGYLEIRDGYWNKSPLLARLCGYKIPEEVRSTSNHMLVRFFSDSSVLKMGFAATFVTACVHQVSSTDGVVSSPNFPDHYPSRKECTWKFETTPGHRIKLVFDSFELEPHQECAYDHVALYDGESADAPLLGRFCGSKVPHPIISTAQTMLMAFRSDPSVQRNGFRATHSTVCGGRLSATQKPSLLYSHAKYGDQNYGSRADCNWIVTAPNSGKVRIHFQSFDLEPEQDCAYDYVQVFDGFETSPSLGKFCGNKIPPDLMSSGFRLLIRFQSDDSISGKGFSLVFSEVFF
ncbi:unnamed protein product [Larinioides sclopetarius]|uniref:Metalloendopeptidase n=1 Tax=Larinioides sclopetarius TaxID=280406 RepID=A0AAV2BGK8_9ARAC